MNKVNVGDLVSVTLYAEVKELTNAATGGRAQFVVPVMRLQDLETEAKYDVQGQPLIDRYASADTYSAGAAITKTKIVEQLLSAGDKVFKVCWTKANGDKRILRGILLSDNMRGLGYIEVADLDIEEDHNLRRVDCRTIEYVILDGVKYTVK